LGEEGGERGRGSGGAEEAEEAEGGGDRKIRNFLLIIGN